ncbi:hypothetical protein C474_06160 [Halogeometricum pallidum JCM 14848]|uniref:Uncharacterized protein n=1 Tax=Halogeometricum pallidum JCM 14848 TaxID=1227487 RepID=M0DF91_HALPD|nr:hypothetical protein [Halogeometricum pallidum]ELZ32834.1 hypothetical protein C474_06160 [Halogeometricum pallidum JCM 14848]
MQRTDERDPSTVDVQSDADAGVQGRPGAERSPNAAGSAGGSDSALFAPKAFLGILVASFAGAVLGGGIPVVGLFGRFLGLLAVGFAVGLLSGRRRYLEVGVAGAVVSALLLVLSTMFSLFAPFAIDLVARYGLAIAGVGAGAGLLASVVGHYFGRDLRDGLTREI